MGLRFAQAPPERSEYGRLGAVEKSLAEVGARGRLISWFTGDGPGGIEQKALSGDARAIESARERDDTAI